MKIIYILQLVFNLNFLLFFCQFANATESSLFETQISSQLSISQLEKFRYFLIDIEKSLPEHIKNIIKQPVRVKFTNADLDLDSLLSCRNNINTQVATLDLLDIQKKEFEITLSSKLLDILKDENSKNQMSCRHKTAIRFRGLTIYDSCYEALKARGRISENRTYKRLSVFIDKSEFHDLNTSLDP